MAILKSESKRKGYKLVGVHLPPRDFEYLNLYTIAKGYTKTKVLLNLIKNWLISSRNVDSETELRQEIANRITSSWKAATTIAFDDFVQLSRQELESKGVGTSDIILILDKVKE